MSSAVSEDYEDQEPFWLRETVHTDIAIWWYIKQHYAESVDAELLHGTDVTALRLAKNDVNILLGWDAVSAYLEEAQSEDDPKKNGYGAKMASLLRKPQSKIWPPASLRDLCDNKGDYLRYLEEKGIPIAPTYVYENNNTDVDEEKISSEEEKKKKKHPGPPMSAATQDAQPPKKRRRLDFLGHAYDLKQTERDRFAAVILAQVRQRGWPKIVVKPSPSSWSRGVECFDLDDKDIHASLATYYDGVHKAKQIIVQRHLEGLETNPETRCFFFGTDFLYAVANATFDDEVTITDHPEAATGGHAESGRRLPAEYFEDHKSLAKRVIDCLPDSKAFDGVNLGQCLLRIDVGLHDSRDLVNTTTDGPTVFINEIEPVPTLYLDPKFGHARDFIAEYADRIVTTAADVLGIVPPGLPPLHADPPEDHVSTS